MRISKWMRDLNKETYKAHEAATALRIRTCGVLTWFNNNFLGPAPPLAADVTEIQTCLWVIAYAYQEIRVEEKN